MNGRTNPPFALWLLLILGTAAGCARTGGERLGHAVVDPDREESATPLPSTGSSAADGLILRGIDVYRQQYCGTCHRLDRAETGGTFGPSHNGFATVAAQRIQADAYTGRATTAAEYIRESVVDPNAYIVLGYFSGWHQMPSYAHLPPGDLEAVIHLLLAED